MPKRFTGISDGNYALTLKDGGLDEWSISGDPGSKQFVIIGDAINRFAELENQACEWLPVSGGLPEKYLPVLISHNNETFCAALNDAGNWLVWMGDGTFVRNIKWAMRWTPLPAPPFN